MVMTLSGAIWAITSSVIPTEICCGMICVLKPMVAPVGPITGWRVTEKKTSSVVTLKTAGWLFSAVTRGLESTKFLDATVAEVMDDPLPVVDGNESVDVVARQLSKANPAVLVSEGGRVTSIVTRSDMLGYLMAR